MSLVEQQHLVQHLVVTDGQADGHRSLASMDVPLVVAGR